MSSINPALSNRLRGAIPKLLSIPTWYVGILTADPCTYILPRKTLVRSNPLPILVQKLNERRASNFDSEGEGLSLD